MKIGIANTVEVDQVWPSISEGMQKACEICPHEWTAGELWQACRSGNAFLCVCFDGGIRMASVWQFDRKDGEPIFRCLALHGSQMAEWVNGTFQFISKIARENGARKLVAKGRKGWVRMFKATIDGDEYEVAL